MKVQWLYDWTSKAVSCGTNEVYPFASFLKEKSSTPDVTSFTRAAYKRSLPRHVCSLAIPVISGDAGVLAVLHCYMCNLPVYFLSSWTGVGLDTS